MKSLAVTQTPAKKPHSESGICQVGFAATADDKEKIKESEKNRLILGSCKRAGKTVEHEREHERDGDSNSNQWAWNGP